MSVARVAVVGGGAIGGFLAAAAQAAGCEVTLCVRTPIERLMIEIDGKLREVPVQIATDPSSQRAADWVLLATKAQDTSGAAAWLVRLTGAGTTIVVLQNGVGHLERIRPFVEDAAVVPALVYAFVELIGPRRILHHTGNRIVVPQGKHGAAFAKLLDGSEIEVVQEADFTTAAWRKLLSNVAANPITALTMRRIGVMRESGIRELARGLLFEAAAAGRAAGVRLTDTDVEDVLALSVTYHDTGGSSMLYDRLASRPLEIVAIATVKVNPRISRIYPQDNCL
jgi:2-dehydropantoate 2-reductase